MRPISHFNGVNGLTGGWLFPAEDENRQEEPLETTLIRRLRRLFPRNREPHLGLPVGVDPDEPREAGWGVVVARDEAPEVQAAVTKLVAHRRSQLGKERVRVLYYRPGESASSWMVRHGAEFGTVDPERVPYYLALVGPPSRIPFSFEFELQLEYRVGRICFDTSADYHRYCEAVTYYETCPRAPAARSAAFVAVRHEGDPVTEMTHDLLVAPFVKGREETGRGRDLIQEQDFTTQALLHGEATKENLLDLLCAPDNQRPSFLLTASHGLAWPGDLDRQRSGQGALLLQDWPTGDRVQREHYLSAEDLGEVPVRVAGLISFHFACYSAGTPRRLGSTNGHSRQTLGEARSPFVAALPKGLLSHPEGSALAVIGHLDRAWGYSVVGATGEAQRLPFENAVRRILAGKPVGMALSDFRVRFGSLGVRLDSLRDQESFGLSPASEEELNALRTERDDARNYLLLGDPAVRLRPEAME